MSQPETDGDYRARISLWVSEEDRPALMDAVGRDLDALGRKYERFRTGIPLTGDARAVEMPDLLRFWPEIMGEDGEPEPRENPPPFELMDDASYYRVPPQTVVGVPYRHDRLDKGPLRAFLTVGRLGGIHTLQYIFVPDDPPLERVEAIVRSRPDYFPGDTVVVDLGESYASPERASWFIAEMQDERPVAMIFLGEDPEKG